MYAAASFMDPMIENGAKNIWSNVKSPTLFGSPKLAAGNYFQKHITQTAENAKVAYFSDFLLEKLNLNTQVWSITQGDLGKYLVAT